MPLLGKEIIMPHTEVDDYLSIGIGDISDISEIVPIGKLLDLTFKVEAPVATKKST